MHAHIDAHMHTRTPRCTHATPRCTHTHTHMRARAYTSTYIDIHMYEHVHHIKTFDKTKIDLQDIGVASRDRKSFLFLHC